MEKTIGKFAEAIFSIKGQSFEEQLAILIASNSNFLIKSTEASSKGVQIVFKDLSLE